MIAQAIRADRIDCGIATRSVARSAGLPFERVVEAITAPTEDESMTSRPSIKKPMLETDREGA